MNTRLQVEHPITEWVTGIDLVREMLRVAAGERLGYGQQDIVRRGAAIECRIYAEDAERGFLPSPGTIRALRVPGGPFVRDDGGVYVGAEVSSHYDPLVSKLSTWAPDRAGALARMRRALGEYVVRGIATNLGFHERLLRHPEFAAGRYHTGFIDAYRAELLDVPSVEVPDPGSLAVALAVAVNRKQRVAAPDSGGKGAAMSPWATAHRAERLRRR